MKISKEFIKNSGLTFAAITLLLFLFPIVCYFLCDIQYSMSEYGNFVGGTAGPFATLAGFAYIYLSFEQQKETHSEDKIDSYFFNLFTLYQKSKLNLKFKNQGRKYVSGDEAFEAFLERLEKWANNEWHIQLDSTKEIYTYFTGVSWKDKPNNWNSKKINQSELKFLIASIYDEEGLGSYLRTLKAILTFCIRNKNIDYLTYLESSANKFERILIYYYIISHFKKDQIDDLLCSDHFKVMEKHMDDFLGNPLKTNKVDFFK